MSDTFTLEIEHATGEDIDVDAVREVLLALDIKVRTWRPGNHILAAVALQRCQEQVEHAVRLALGDGEDDEDQE